MKCDNCSNEAVYSHVEPGVSPAHYCGNCLPHWLNERAIAGHFPLLTTVHKDVERSLEQIDEDMQKIIDKTEAELKKVSKKKAAPTATEAPVDENN